MNIKKKDSEACKIRIPNAIYRTAESGNPDDGTIEPKQSWEKSRCCSRFHREKNVKNEDTSQLNVKNKLTIEWDVIRNSRSYAWRDAWQLGLKLKLEPIVKKEANDLCPWAFPGLCKNIDHRNSLLDYCFEHSLANRSAHVRCSFASSV